MSTNITDVSFDESKTIIIEYVNTTGSETSFEADELEFQPHGVMISREQTFGTAPDPVTTTRFTQFVPYTNIRALRQSYQVA